MRWGSAREREDLCTDNTTYHWRADREQKNRNCFYFLRPARTTQSSFIYLFAVRSLISRCADRELSGDKIRSSTYVGAVESRWSCRTHGLIAGTRSSSLICNLQVEKVFALITRAHRIFCFCGMSCVFAARPFFAEGQEMLATRAQETTRKSGLLFFFSCFDIHVSGLTVKTRGKMQNFWLTPINVVGIVGKIIPAKMYLGCGWPWQNI